MTKEKSSEEKYVLLVVPKFPIPPKRRIHHDFLPIGLLKIGTYLKHKKGYKVRLVFGNKFLRKVPDEILITSLFTYWSSCVVECADFYHKRFPSSRIRIGGIYASLLPDEVRKLTNARVHVGVHRAAEQWCNTHGVDYDILDAEIDFQILHGMRGCFRKCKFCGVWRIEPKEEFDKGVVNRVIKNHVIFYDNNLLRHPNIAKLLDDLSKVRINGRKVRYESQSGFDGRILTYDLAKRIHAAGFTSPRIAWDNSYSDWHEIENQIKLLVGAGYKSRDIFVFMIYNWKLDFDTMEKKRIKCYEWKVQIADCRYRPLDQLYDNYDPRKSQTKDDYHIHGNWTDKKVKAFRRNIRWQNICVRHSFPFYSTALEHKKVNKQQYQNITVLSKEDIRKKIPDAWFPDKI